MVHLLGEQGKTINNRFDDVKSAEHEQSEPSLRRRKNATCERTGEPASIGSEVRVTEVTKKK